MRFRNIVFLALVGLAALFASPSKLFAESTDDAGRLGAASRQPSGVVVESQVAKPVALVVANISFKDASQLGNFSFHLDVPFNADARIDSVESIWGEAIPATDLAFIYFGALPDGVTGRAILKIYRSSQSRKYHAASDTTIFLPDSAVENIPVLANTAGAVLPCRTLGELNFWDGKSNELINGRIVRDVSVDRLRSLLRAMDPAPNELHCRIPRLIDHFIFPGHSAGWNGVLSDGTCDVEAEVNRSGRAERARIRTSPDADDEIFHRCRYSALYSEYQVSKSDQRHRTVKFRMEFENVGTDRVTIEPANFDGNVVMAFNSMFRGKGESKSRLIIAPSGDLIGKYSVKEAYGKHPQARSTHVYDAAYQLCHNARGGLADFAVVSSERLMNGTVRVFEIYRAGKRVRSLPPDASMERINSRSLPANDPFVVDCLRNEAKHPE